jgi:hypothetical protein
MDDCTERDSDVCIVETLCKIHKRYWASLISVCVSAKEPRLYMALTVRSNLMILLKVLFFMQIILVAT